MLFWLLCWQCYGGGRWRCRGSRTAAPSAAVLLFQAAERLLLFPSLLVFCFFPSLYSLLSCLFLSQTLPCFKLVFFPPLSLSLFLSLSRLLSFSFPPVSFLFFPLLPLCNWCWVVFIGQRERGRPYRHPIAAHEE